ncbi:MAG: cysteine hydrolase [Euryarchaeota archaeon]|nr:cysteine hydrolase [Euryarchaeota archaeon]
MAPRTTKPPPLALPARGTAVMVMDMQNDFCEPRGTLCVPGALDIVPRLSALLNRARLAGAPVVYTQDWHPPDDREHFAIWPSHCIRDTWGAEVIGDLRPRGRDYRVKKGSYTGFHRTDLEEFLERREVETLVFTGVCTNICVLHTASDAALRGYRVAVARDCVRALSDYAQEYALHHITTILKGTVEDSKSIEFIK